MTDNIVDLKYLELILIINLSYRLDLSLKYSLSYYLKLY